MDLDKLTIRTFLPDQDMPRLLGLYAAAKAIDPEVGELSEASLREQLSRSGHDPLRDRWVVEQPDGSPALIASGEVTVAPKGNLAEANIVVHPDWRRIGIGRKVLSKIVERARELEIGPVQICANVRQPPGAAFLQKNGFVAQGAYTELGLLEGIRLPPVIWPFGYTMRPFGGENDLPLLTEVINLAYVPLWGHLKVTEDEMVPLMPDLKRKGIFMVFSEKGRVVGLIQGEPSAERSENNGIPTGYIDAPGVVPQHRRLDLYRALVLTAIGWLYDQGQKIIEMESWGDKLEVLKMYRELGFQDIRQLVCYHLVL